MGSWHAFVTHLQEKGLVLDVERTRAKLAINGTRYSKANVAAFEGLRIELNVPTPFDYETVFKKIYEEHGPAETHLLKVKKEAPFQTQSFSVVPASEAKREIHLSIRKRKVK